MDFDISFERQTLVDSLAVFVEKGLYPHEALVEELRRVPGELAAAALELTAEDLDAIEHVLAEVELQGARYPAHLQQRVGR